MQVGRYRVVKKLGEGGMATVFLAASPTGEHVVLKIPHTASDDTQERVRDEARIGIRLSHPHIVETLDLFQHEGKPILVVAYVAGASLKDARRLGPMPPAAVCRVGRQIADALHAIHEATDELGRHLGILHRDVAPGNILLNVDGDAQLIDLGIARSTERRAQSTGFGQVKGTFRYLAPEIFHGKGYSRGSDLWSLGVTLFEAAVGRKAVTGSDQEILAAIIGGRLLDLRAGERLPGRLVEVLKQLLAPAEARFKSAGVVAKVFATISDELGDGAEEARAYVARLPQGDNLGETATLDEDGGAPAAAGDDPEGWDKSTVRAVDDDPLVDDMRTATSSPPKMTALENGPPSSPVPSLRAAPPQPDERAPTVGMPMVRDPSQPPPVAGPPRSGAQPRAPSSPSSASGGSPRPASSGGAGAPPPITFPPERPPSSGARAAVAPPASAPPSAGGSPRPPSGARPPSSSSSPSSAPAGPTPARGRSPFPNTLELAPGADSAPPRREPLPTIEMPRAQLATDPTVIRGSAPRAAPPAVPSAFGEPIGSTEPASPSPSPPSSPWSAAPSSTPARARVPASTGAPVQAGPTLQLPSVDAPAAPNAAAAPPAFTGAGPTLMIPQVDLLASASPSVPVPSTSPTIDMPATIEVSPAEAARLLADAPRPAPPSHPAVAPRRRSALWVAAGVVAALVLAAIAVVALAGCAGAPPPTGEGGAAADALARRMVDGVDGAAWDRTGAVSFSFRGKRTHLWDKARGFDRVVDGDMTVLVDGAFAPPHVRGVARKSGTVVGGDEGKQLVHDAWKRMMNDTFWANPVVKLFDDGVVRERVVLEDGREGLLASFTSGGATPGDRYLFLVGDDGKPTSFRMWVQGLPNGTEFAFAGWTKLATGALVATSHPGLNDVRLDPIAGAAALADLEPGPDPFAALSASR